jgi:hypothetical protein
MRVGRRRGCGINAIDRGHPCKFRAYGAIGWWNVFRISSFNGSKAITFTDLFGGGLDATQSTDAKRATFDGTGWNGKPCVDFGNVGTIGYVTANVSLGTSTMICVVSGLSNAQYVMTHDTDNNYIFGNASASIRANRGANASQKAVNATWVRDSVKKQVARTFNGTHATHRALVNGVDQNATDLTFTADPGTGTASAPIGLGCTSAVTTTFRGLATEWIVYSTAMAPNVLRRIYNRQRALWPMP